MIRFESVAFGYRAGDPVVRGISAGFAPGAVTAVIGPNGSGKSTVLKLMLGLLAPGSGQVVWREGQGVSGPVVQTPEHVRARWLAYVPQRGSVAFGFSVQQVVAMGAMGGTGGGQAERMEDVLARFDLQAVRQRPFEQLSGGQQQRVVLARAVLQRDTGHANAEPSGRPGSGGSWGGLCRGPSGGLSRGPGGAGGLVLDEPVSAMDLRHAQRVMATLRARAGRGETVVVVLHDLTLAARYADRVWLLDSGALVAEGAADAVMTAGRLSSVYGVQIETVSDARGRPVFVVGDDL